MLLQELNIEVFADYFQFYIQDEEAEINGELWTDECTNQMLATSYGLIGITTARNMDVPVNIKVFDVEPNRLELNQVDKINEAELAVSSGKIAILGPTDYFPDALKVDLRQGVYKARVYYRNLDMLSSDSLDGDDSYEIHLWLNS